MYYSAICVVLMACGEQHHYRPSTPESATLLTLRRSASSLYRSGNLAAAESKYEQILKSAVANGDRLEEAKALWGIGNCRLANYEFSEALKRYSGAEAIAVDLQEDETAGLIRVAMNDTYQRLGDRAHAEQWIRAAVQILPRNSNQFAFALFNLALSENGRGAHESAEFHFREAIRSAEISSDSYFLQNAFNHFGHYLVESGQLDRASDILSRAFLLNKLGRSPFLATTWMNLGMLSLAQGHPERAREELTRAIAVGREGHQIFVEQGAFYWRATAEASLGLLPEALADYETARQQSRAWRRSIPPGDLRDGASDVWLTRMYNGYLSTAMRLFEQTKNPALASRMFELAEESRYLSLQEQLRSSRDLPREYWATVSQLRSAELDLYRAPSDAKRDLRDELEHRLLRWENDGIRAYPLPGTGNALVPGPESTLVRNAQHNNENFRSESSLSRYKELVSPRDLYLSFQVGDRESYLWLLTTTQFKLLQLPGRADLEGRIATFRKALEEDSAELPVLSERLYGILFHGIPPNLAAMPNWILSLDGALFDLPFAALRFPLPNGDSRFLIERNSLRIIPGISILDPSRPKPGVGRFVGIGDPVYNNADCRWPATPDRGPTEWFNLRAQQTPEPLLARLPGSGREIETCARTWPAKQAPVLLSGREITRPGLESLLSTHPAVLHFATHVLQPMAQRELAIIAIGLDARGQPDFLTPNEIAAHQYKPGLIVMTGCSSGRGKALPGVGLFGLTRAWLLSGAQSVVASHWPTPDESGELFQKFYQAYPFQGGEISSASVAGALRSAQVAMLHSGSWRRKPHYWAGFYVMGKD